MVGVVHFSRYDKAPLWWHIRATSIFYQIILMLALVIDERQSRLTLVLNFCKQQCTLTNAFDERQTALTNDKVVCK